VIKPIGILGGTFDPIHYGHLRPAQEVLRGLDLAEVLIIPAANPPHRRPPLATAQQRMHMAGLAVAEFPGLRVDDREIIRGGPSYTVLTLESLREEFGARPLCLLLGLDAFEGLGTWHQWQRLPELAHFVVMTRPGWSLPSVDVLPAWTRGRLAHAAGDLARVSTGKIYFQTVTPQDISATRIREAIARGEPVDGLLPPAVLDYLRANRIYLNREN
jgi:nicotinate-nucleotide adenylyltransferase